MFQKCCHLQLFDFVEIREGLLDKFSLYVRHGLTPGDPKYMYYANLLYQERVSISPTRYESVEITCQDEDPQVAKDMVDELLRIFNATTC